VAIGCVFSLLVVIVLVVVAWSLVTQRFMHGGYSCLPSDFQTYPGSTFAGETYDLNAPTPGNSCQMMFDSSQSPDAVYTYYTSNLNTGEWQVVSSDPTSRHIAFRSTRKPKTSGTVDIGVRDGHAEYTVQLYS
jgi:hypothetical protein